LRCDLLDYELPPDRIARRPTEARDAARLLVVDPSEIGRALHRHVFDLAELLPRGALLVVNDTRVVPARLLGKKVGTGGHVELLLVRPRPVESAPAGTAAFFAMGRSSKPLRTGSEMTFGEGELTARIDGRDADGVLFAVTLRAKNGDVQAALERVGHVPLPPYLRRADDEADRERYQTVFARVTGAIAAPTAGLHQIGRAHV